MEEFERIYREYYDTVFRYALSLCKDEGFAEEITQDAFFKALKSIDKFRGECKLSVWLCQIAKNIFLTAEKHRKRQRELSEELTDSEKSVEEKITDKETAVQIHRRLHLLEEPYKEVFWMHTFGELSFKAIPHNYCRADAPSDFSSYRTNFP